MKKPGARIAAAALLTAASGMTLTMMAAPAMAGSSLKTFEIPAQPLATAILAYSRQSGIPVLAPMDLMEGKAAPTVRGRLSPAEALERLLDGSRLRSVAGQKGGVALTKISDASHIQGQGFPAPVQVKAQALAQAQPLPQAPASSTDSAPAVAEAAEQSGLVDIVVTARRRNESLLETPVAVTAFDAAELERRSIQQVSEIQKSTPSLIYEATAGNSSEARIFIRGVGNFNPNITSDAGVGIYIDGAYFGRAQGGLIDNLDIASVEVLRGPQGTLFGKNTIGGAINITSTKPSTDAFSGALEAGYGRFDHMRVRGSVNIPLGDKVAVRLAGMRDRDDGYSVNDVDGRHLDNRNILALSGSLRITPTDNLTLDVNAMYSRDRSHGRGYQCVQIANNAILGAAFPPACAATNANGIRHTRSDVRLNGGAEVVAASSTLAWDIGQFGVIDDLTIKAIGAYQWIDSQREIDFDATSLRAIFSKELDKKTAQISGELQILGQAFDKHLNFVFGAYGDREHTPGSGARYSAAYPFLDATRPIPLNNVRTINLHNKSRALYSQATYDFNDIVSVTGGIRYTKETKGFYMQKYAVRDADRSTRIGPFTTDGLFTRDFSTWTPMGSLQLNAPEAWTNNGFLDKAMLYFTYSKGFKSGGFNGNGDSIAGNLTSFEPEKVDNYEVGFKFSMFDRRLIGSLSRYDMRYQDIQLSVQGISPTSGAPIASTFNAGRATIQGIEVELQALLFDSLRLSFNGDFNQPRYTRFADRSVPGGSRVGEPLAFIPDYRISGSIENRFDLGNDMALTPRAQVTRTGERFMITDVSPVVREIGRVPALTLADASLRFDLNEKVSFDVYGKNVFNKKYKNDALAVGFVVLAYYASPVTYGATARMKF
jgi:iron complex outermembrane receptor protein